MKTREVLAWVWLAVCLVTVTAICAVLVRFSVPRQNRLLLGTLSDFPVGQPDFRAVASDTSVYLVKLDGTPVAWDARAPLDGTRCQIRWVPTNNRFEDPCSGDKWCLDGTLADNRYGADRTLDRYSLHVDDDSQVWLNPAQQATGVPMLDVPESFGSYAYLCDHLR